MAAYNRRAEGRRPPRRGRSERIETPVSGAILDQEASAPGDEPSHRESRELLRQRGRSEVRAFDKQTPS
jgi:hypothetical protein